MSATPPLWTKDFLFFNGAVFLAFANLAVFFYLEEYLRTLPIDPRWFGLLIGLFAAVSLVLRPFLSLILRPDNARRWIFASTLGVMAALAAYGWPKSVFSMGLLRLFHGTAHVVLATALFAGLVHRIPPAKSGQAFGLISIVTLLPYAVIPPFLKMLMGKLGGYPQVLALMGLIMALIFPLVLLDRHPIRKDSGPEKARLNSEELRGNFGDLRIGLILSAMLLFYSGYAVVFFFLAGFVRKIGLTEVGWFFTLSTIGEIGIRLVGSSWFNRKNKRGLLAGSLVAVAGGYFYLPWVTSEGWLFILGGFLGLGWGVAMPVLNALLFDCSTARMRAFNTNLGLQMFQTGFFIGPLLGAFIVQQGGYEGLFYFCAALALVSSGLMFRLPERKENRRG
jgi:predicted MFS family arabinose efflux permease